MLAQSPPHGVFAFVTEDRPEAMNQALRLAFLIEKDILNSPRPFLARLSVQDILDRYKISRSVGHEAIRILQHRHIIQAKRGPSGGLHVVPQDNENVKAAIKRYLLQRGFALERCNQAREGLMFISANLSPANPARALATLALEIVDELRRGEDSNVCAVHGAPQTQLRADQVAFAILLGAGSVPGEVDARIGHEEVLSERFRVSRPVIRQAIRILEAESIVATRRGRGCGVYLTSPHAGPVARLLALWLLGRNTSFPHVFEFEHPLRVAIAMQASRNDMTQSESRQLLELQSHMESDSRVQLIDIINMERRVSCLADNYLLGLLLKSITVYKISRAQYQECVKDPSTSYTSLNREFLQGLFAHRDLQIENFCQEKNHYLMNYDLDSMAVH